MFFIVFNETFLKFKKYVKFRGLRPRTHFIYSIILVFEI